MADAVLVEVEATELLDKVSGDEDEEAEDVVVVVAVLSGGERVGTLSPSRS